MSKTRRSRRVEAIYGRSLSGLALAAVDRRRDMIMQQDAIVAKEPEFRELGRVSSVRYVPRAKYKGGGILDREGTAALNLNREVVSALEPRLATTSIPDNTLRLVSQPYADQRTWTLRCRDQTKELGPPFRFVEKNDLERVSTFLESLVVNDEATPYTGKLAILQPTWRVSQPGKWVGHRFQHTGPPAPRETHDLSRRPFPSLRASESYVIHSKSVHAVHERALRYRESQPQSDKPRWTSSTRLLPSASAPDLRPKFLHQSMKDVEVSRLARSPRSPRFVLD